MYNFLTYTVLHETFCDVVEDTFPLTVLNGGGVSVRNRTIRRCVPIRTAIEEMLCMSSPLIPFVQQKLSDRPPIRLPEPDGVGFV